MSRVGVLITTRDYSLAEKNIRGRTLSQSLVRAIIVPSVCGSCSFDEGLSR